MMWRRALPGKLRQWHFSNKALRYVNLRGELRDADMITGHKITLGDKCGCCSYIPNTSLHTPVLHQLHKATSHTLKTQRVNAEKHIQKGTF